MIICHTRIRILMLGLLLPVTLTACANRPATYSAADPVLQPPTPAMATVEVGGQRSEVGGQRSEVGGQRSEVGGRRSEVGDQRSEDRDQTSDDGSLVQASVESPPHPLTPSPPHPVTPSPADDTAPVADDTGLTLADFETMALQAHPTLQQLAAVVDKARGVHDQVGKYPNPVVGYLGNEMGSDGTLGMQGGFVSQTIVTGDKLEKNREVACWNIQEFSWLYQTRKYRVLNDVRLRFYEALGAQQRVEVAKDLVRVAEGGVETAKLRLKAQRGTRADVLQASIDLNEVQILQKNAEYDAEAAWKRLTIAVARTDLAPTKLAGELKGETRDRSLQESAKKLLEESPQLEAARSRVQGARTAIARQEVQPIPNLLTQIGGVHDNSSGENLVNVQIGLPLPVFNRNEGNIQTAWGEYHRAIRESQRLELQLRDTLTAAFRDYRKAKFQVERYEKDILPAAKENLDIVEKTYKAGQLSFLRVLTARRSYFETNLEYVRSLTALRQAEVVIDGYVLTGGLTDVPDFANRSLSTVGQRGQALSGQ